MRIPPPYANSPPIGPEAIAPDLVGSSITLPQGFGLDDLTAMSSAPSHKWAVWEKFENDEKFRAFMVDSAELEGAALRAKEGKTHKLRKQLYQLHDAYRDHCQSKRVGLCGRVRLAPSVAIASSDGRCQLGGLIRCRSKACPLCLYKRRTDYADQILRVCELWRTGWEGGPVELPDKVDKAGNHTKRDPILELEAHKGAGSYLATFTIRHGFSDDLKLTGRGIRKAWGKFLNHRQWREIRKLYGFEYIVANEVTHGKNGWHPHIHVLFLPAKPVPYDAMLGLAEQLFTLWSAMVVKHIGATHEPLPDYGLDFKRTVASGEDYISKCIGLELSDPGHKVAKGGGRTPMQLLQSWTYNDDEGALALYQEYERAMHGYRDLTWSAGLRSYRAVAIWELKNEAAELALERDLVAELPGPIWDRWRRQDSPHVRILEAAEGGGLAGVLELIRLELGAWAADQVAELTERTRDFAESVEASRDPPGSDLASLQGDPQAADDPAEWWAAIVSSSAADPF